MSEVSRASPRVFISYSHDSEEHAERVLGLSERLRRDGVETALDQYVKGTPEQKWPRWMLDQFDWAERVIVVCTPTYYRRFRGHERPEVGKGADFEGAVITQAIYDAKSATTKFVPVLFEVTDSAHIPEPLRGHTDYVLGEASGYETLLDFLLDQAGVEAGPVGSPPRRLRRRGEPLTFPVAPEPVGPRIPKRPWLRPIVVAIPLAGMLAACATLLLRPSAWSATKRALGLRTKTLIILPDRNVRAIDELKKHPSECLLDTGEPASCRGYRWCIQIKGVGSFPLPNGGAFFGDTPTTDDLAEAKELRPAPCLTGAFHAPPDASGKVLLLQRHPRPDDSGYDECGALACQTAGGAKEEVTKCYVPFSWCQPR